MCLLSVVAYSVVMGALMASGKEVIGRIPKGKVKSVLVQKCTLRDVSDTSETLTPLMETKPLQALFLTHLFHESD